MAVTDWSETPASNLTIGGISIAEGCAAANINNAIRQMMADVKSYSLTVTSPSSYMPLSGGAFTGSITRSSAGAYPYFASSSLTGGAIYVQPSATALPSSPTEGTIVMQY